MGNAAGVPLGETEKTTGISSSISARFRKGLVRAKKRITARKLDDFVPFESQIAMSTERLVGLMGCPCDERAIGHLNCAKIERLFLAYNDLTGELVGALLANIDKCSLLKELSIKSNSIGNTGLVSLGIQLKHNKTIVNLALDDNAIDSEGLKEFSRECLSENDTIETLCLRSNPIGTQFNMPIEDDLLGMETRTSGFYQMLDTIAKNPASRLMMLDLRDCKLQPEDGEAIRFLLQSKAIVRNLTLGGNNLQDKGCEYISEGLRGQRKLKVIKLAANHITDAGVKMLADVVPTCGLKLLFLHANKIGDASADALVVAIAQGCQLRKVTTFGTQMSKAASERLEHAIHTNNPPKQKPSPGDDGRNFSNPDPIPKALGDLWTSNIRRFLMFKCNSSKVAYDARSAMLQKQAELFSLWKQPTDLSRRKEHNDKMDRIFAEMKEIARKEQARLQGWADEIFFIVIMGRLRWQTEILSKHVRLDGVKSSMQTLQTAVACTGPWSEEPALYELYTRAAWVNSRFHRSIQAIVDLFNQGQTSADYGIDPKVFKQELQPHHLAKHGEKEAKLRHVVYEPGPLKDMQRCRAKLKAYSDMSDPSNRGFPFPRAARIQDIVRGQIRSNSPYALAAFYAFLRRCEHNDPPILIDEIWSLPEDCRGIRVTRVKNLFAGSGGDTIQYRNALVNVEYEGHVCELQFALSDLHAIKSQMHVFYNAQRAATWDALLKKPMKKLAKYTKIVFLIGGAGAGKTTAGKAIAENYGYGFLSIGNLVRAEKKKQTRLGKLFQENTKVKKMQPTDILLKMAFNHMRTGNTNVPPVYIIDGFPRDTEFVDLWKRTAPTSFHVHMVVRLEVSFETRLKRLGARARNSYDNNVEHQRARERQYKESRNAIEDALREGLHTNAVTINADGSKETTYRLLERTLHATL